MQPSIGLQQFRLIAASASKGDSSQAVLLRTSRGVQELTLLKPDSPPLGWSERLRGLLPKPSPEQRLLQTALESGYGQGIGKALADRVVAIPLTAGRVAELLRQADTFKNQEDSAARDDRYSEFHARVSAHLVQISAGGSKRVDGKSLAVVSTAMLVTPAATQALMKILLGGDVLSASKPEIRKAEEFAAQILHSMGSRPGMSAAWLESTLKFAATSPTDQAMELVEKLRRGDSSGFGPDAPIVTPGSSLVLTGVPQALTNGRSSPGQAQLSSASGPSNAQAAEDLRSLHSLIAKNQEQAIRETVSCAISAGGEIQIAEQSSLDVDRINVSVNGVTLPRGESKVFGEIWKMLPEGTDKARLTLLISGAACQTSLGPLTSALARHSALPVPVPGQSPTKGIDIWAASDGLIHVRTFFSASPFILAGQGDGDEPAIQNACMTCTQFVFDPLQESGKEIAEIQTFAAFTSPSASLETKGVAA